MTNFRKKWSGKTLPQPELPSLVLSRLTQWTPDSSKKYSTLNGYEPNNLTAAVAWTKIPDDLVASDAFIYKDKLTGLWIQAVGYPLIGIESIQTWIDLQMSQGACQYWTNLNAQPRLPQKPLTLREVSAKNIDQITYIEMIDQQNKFVVNGVDMTELVPWARARSVDVLTTRKPRKTYTKRDTGVFHIRSNSKFLTTPKGVYFSVSAAAADMGLSFCGLTYHLKRGSNGFRYITEEEYLVRTAKLNTNSTTE
jgi:hypothetical protein